jgi:hypothetical protein
MTTSRLIAKVETGPKRSRTDSHHWVMQSAMQSLVTLEQTP